MIVHLIVVLMWTLTGNWNSDVPISLIEQKMPDGSIVIKSDNREFRPYTLEITWQVKNVKTPSSKYFVVPGNVKNHTLFSIKPTSKSYSYSYHFTCIPGDIGGAKHNDESLYRIPFAEGYQGKISQAYDGSYSHKGVKAIDFVAPQGTVVCAARGGLVVEIVEQNKTGCASPKCMRSANFIKILHDDGSEALYSHLKYQGVSVRPGDFVKSGDVIGYSGNTGWTTNPHLHFEVQVPDYKGGRSVTTYFLVNGKKVSLEKGDIIN